ncbi:MAG: hypothetical protein H6733_16060 [Alphaproteobacteria bacterium]|nr:hypothetical protein [Alphaproteobacteria bacterium]
MDELYVVARCVLLDALEALGTHRDAIVVVGAQAIYLRAGEADLVVAPYTTDGDLALDPDLLAEIPPLEDALRGAAFTAGGRDAVGVWVTRRDTPSKPDVQVQVDLLVPEVVSPGRGRRAARLPGHEPTAARIVRGLEGVLVDQDLLTLRALDPNDARALKVKVAGPAGLLVAKLHKLDERKGTARANDKDALDVFRLLRGVPTSELAARMRRLRADARSADAGARGMVLLAELFERGGKGAEMAARAVAGVLDAAEVSVACDLLAADLSSALGGRRPA